MSIVVLDKFAQTSVPHLDGSIDGRSSDASAVGSELTAQNFGFMFCEGGWDGGFGDIPQFDAPIIWAAEKKSLIKRNLALSDPIGMPDKALFELAIKIPHFDGFVGGAAHKKVLLSGQTHLEDWTWMCLHCFVFSVANYSN